MACQTTPEQQATPQPYKEKYRPQFHFSPPANWMNDPNGMVYYAGEYHLFYQYYPDSTVWGPMHWGHAISKDMVTWENLPVAIYPDSLGYIFSGSAVVDAGNTSGLGTAENPAMVAIYTYHQPDKAAADDIDYQYQGIAYSLDKGRTWTKYADNPVLPNPGIQDFRDPKVSWLESAGKWVMTLAVADHIRFYSSPDLLNWTLESEFGKGLGAHGGVWECPDLFELPVAGTGDSKWVLLVSINPGGPNGGSATQYFIGQFDGQQFVPDEPAPAIRWIDQGADNYAGVTWANVPPGDGRRLFLGWMSNWQYAQVVPTSPWRSAMTLPRELKLEKVGDELLLTSYPVAEVAGIVQPGVTATPQNGSAVALGDSLAMIDITLEGNSFDGLSLTLANEAGESFELTFTDSVATTDRSGAGLTSFEPGFGARHQAFFPAGMEPSALRIYLDASSIEIFVNEGALVMTELVFPTTPFTTITPVWREGAEVTGITVSRVKPIW